MHLKEARILIVDDEPGLVEIFQNWLQREGCTTETADNGARGLELAMQSQFDLIISDVRMPVMTGIEMATQISKRCRYMPKIVFISGFSDMAERECYDIGIECLLSKPSRRADFLAAARRSLTPRPDLWGVAPPSRVETSLDVRFASLADARSDGRIAFGRGGFCVRSDLSVPASQDIGFRLDFAADRQMLAGQGIVRWVEHATREMGVEITYAEDHCRDWVVGLSQGQDTGAFIPRQCDRGQAPS